MTGVDTAALLEEVANIDGTFVIDHAFRLVDQLVAKLGNERLNRNLINGAVGRNAGNHIAEGDYLSKFGLNAREAIMQAPEQMDGMAHESRGIVYRHRATSNHANLWIFEGSTEIIKGILFWDNIGTNQYNNRAASLFEKEINSRSFAFAFFLYT